MSVFMKPKKRSWSVFLMLTVSGIIGFWMLWKQQQEKQRPRFTDQMNHVMDGSSPPEQSSESHDDGPVVANRHDSNHGPVVANRHDSNQMSPCVLYHTYVAANSRETCTPNHWHATYWLRFVTVVDEPEPIRALVQHTDTKRYHLMVQLPGDDPLPCDDCISAHEVFRLPVQDHYAYFVFIPHQTLDGFATIPDAQEAAQSLSIPGDLHQLLLSGKMKSVLSEV